MCVALFLILGLGLSNEDPIGRNPNSIIRLECHTRKDEMLSYTHLSSPRDGIPFNDRKEHNVGLIAYEWRFQIK